MTILSIVALTILVALIFIATKTLSKKAKPTNLSVAFKKILADKVDFYQALSAVQKEKFEQRIATFLARTTITGVGTTVEDIDRVLIGASAVIPIFAFDGWQYNNIDEVLLYKDSFNKEYDQAAEGRNILGMVGDGAMQRQMILSQPALRSGFSKADAHNTGIHEFVHLLDKADGATDGIPEYLLTQPYMIPWVKKMQEEITKLHADRNNDINYYAATNQAEFFAVVSEYFFERPHQLEEKHPQLYALLEQMFKTDTLIAR